MDAFDSLERIHLDRTTRDHRREKHPDALESLANRIVRESLLDQGSFEVLCFCHGDRVGQAIFTEELVQARLALPPNGLAGGFTSCRPSM